MSDLQQQLLTLRHVASQISADEDIESLLPDLVKSTCEQGGWDRGTVMPFSSEAELIELANDTEYGLAAGIWTKDIDRALRFTRGVDAGTVWINTYRSAAYMSANGGTKHSGYGRRGGFEVMREFSRVKNVVVDYSGAMQDPFVIRLR